MTPRPSYTLYQVDAFSSRVFGGNPAAVCPLQEWLPDAVMQQIAAENNLSETAFFVPEGEGFHIRWFTPKAEIELCGHATLASAHVLFVHQQYPKPVLNFRCKVGMLRVSREAAKIVLDFPAASLKKEEIRAVLEEIFGQDTVEGYYEDGAYGVAVLATEEMVAAMQPDLARIAQLSCEVFVVTARGTSSDFVSRVFAPKLGIPEDPVTGSAHTRLIPYWAGVFGKNKLSAIQLSERRGYLDCTNLGDRVLMSGEAVTYMQGVFYL
jgi:PhzF family phenazine biosynthesis protein